jgi:hypothetical protein
LNNEAQAAFWEYVQPHLALRIPAKQPKNVSRPKGLKPEGIEEMLRSAAAMEHVSVPDKTWLGELIIARLNEQLPAGGPWAWSVGRLGARAPLYGSAHSVIPPSEVIPWIDRMVASEKLDGSIFALAQLARRTGDRARDIDDATRERVFAELQRRDAADSLIQTVREAGELKAAEEAKIFGDTLPLGLQLTRV